MDFTEALTSHSLILTECAISEQLRRQPEIELHPTLFNTPLLYQPYGREKMRAIYQQYRQTALQAHLPVLLCAPTWRVDQKRLAESEFSSDIIGDAVDFIREIGTSSVDAKSPFFTGGLIGPKNDCYSPDQALSVEEGTMYHKFQVKLLEKSNVDVIVAQTIPAISEALGIAEAVSLCSDTPYLISFVINRHGLLLDATPIEEAMAIIDSQATRPPLGYMVNCVYPSFLHAEEQPQLFKRLIGIQANSSSLDHEQLDGSRELQQDSLDDWGQRMIELNSRFGVKILGGCCGTDNSYLRYIVEHRNKDGRYE